MLSDSHGAFWDEPKANQPAMYSNISETAAPTCCECDKMKEKNYYLFKGKFNAKKQYKDHPAFHSIDSYQTCSCHMFTKGQKQPDDRAKFFSEEPVEQKENMSYLDYIKGKAEP